MVIWIIGLAGAGKSTLAAAVHERLQSSNPATVLLDGDKVREVIGGGSHTLEGRRENAWRICRLCELLDSQGIDVVCAVLSIFEEHRDWNRRHLSRYLEVYLDVPLDVLQRRDQHGLYSEAAAGRIRDVVGVDLPFEVPARPDLTLDSSGQVPLEQLVAAVLEAVAEDR